MHVKIIFSFLKYLNTLRLVFDSPTNNWYLYDGYLENGNKGSTNGLW